MMLVLVGLSRADIVYFKNRATKKEDEYRGTIEEENPVGIKIKLKAGKMEIKEVPTQDIVRVVYETPDVDPVTFRAPFNKERSARGMTRPKQREKALVEAMDGYIKLGAALRGRPNARRYIQYKIAEVAVLQAQDDPTKVDNAIKLLMDFKQDGKSSWLALPALKTLARLQEDAGRTDDARKTYEELADLPDVPREMRQESEILVGRLLLRGGKPADAEKRLEKLNATMSEGDSQRPLVQAYLAEARIGQNKMDTVEKDLKQLIRGTTDNRVRGVAYNLLGDFYIKKGQGDDAFWSYLRVDAMYNDDVEEQAKALFRLSTLFDKVKKDPIRGKECADRLQGKRFMGTIYQKLAKAAETKEK
jgi:hypothetical protein